ncbi:MAG: WhiB family transcriptional regulator [Actinomycetota bacterium]|nr:WhiB family transcriptional regulator [Actinomycetota bacterium]
MPTPRQSDTVRLDSAPLVDVWSLPAPPAWVDDALCAQIDTDGFFPEGRGANTRFAKSICAQCPVTEKCLQYALDNGERFGVWGGKSERERRKLERAAAERRAS